MSYEKASLGFYVTGHPLEGYRDVLRSFSTQTVADLRKKDSGSRVSVAGITTNLRRRKSKSGDWWASLQLEDLEGHVDVLVFPKTYVAYEQQLEGDRATLVSGRVESDEDSLRIIAEEVCPLDELLERHADAVEVRIDAGALDDELLEGLMGAITANRGDAQVFFEVAEPGAFRLTMRAGSSCRVTPSRRFTRDVEAVVGPDRVRYRPRARGEQRGRARQVRT